jgi:hypothetical protein
MVKLVFTIPLVRLDPCHLVMEDVTVGAYFNACTEAQAEKTKKGRRVQMCLAAPEGCGMINGISSSAQALVCA